MVGWIGREIDKQAHSSLDQLSDQRTDKWTDFIIYGWAERCKEGYTDEWMEGWAAGCMG